MITEYGSIKAGVTIDKNVQKGLVRNKKIFGLVMLILGGIGIAVYMVLSILSIFIKIKEPSILILVLFSVVFACGLLLFITMCLVVKNAGNGFASVSYEFFADCLIAEDYINGNKTGSVKFYYNQIIKRKETASYLYFYINGSSALAIDKRDLTEGEINALRTFLGLPVKGGEVVSVTAVSEGVPSAEGEGNIEQ